VRVGRGGHSLRNPAQERLPPHHAGEMITLAGLTVHSGPAGRSSSAWSGPDPETQSRAMADKKPERVVCLDEGFAGNDQLKANHRPDLQDQGRHQLPDRVGETMMLQLWQKLQQRTLKILVAPVSYRCGCTG